MSDIPKQEAAQNVNQRISLEELLSAPIREIVKAQNELALQQVNFLLENCFKKVGDNYEPITVNLTMNTNAMPCLPADPSLEQDKTTMNLPLLSMMPFNSLNVDKVTLNFDLDIAVVNMPSLQGSMPHIMVKTIETPQGDVEANITAQQEEDMPNRLKLTVDLGQLPLNNDVNAIIDAFTRSVSATK